MENRDKTRTHLW